VGFLGLHSKSSLSHFRLIFTFGIGDQFKSGFYCHPILQYHSSGFERELLLMVLQRFVPVPNNSIGSERLF
jgi:hypothetical protein